MKNLKAIKIVSLFFIGLLSVFGINNISFELPNTNSGVSNSSEVSTDCYQPGDIIYENGWTGWIDPELTGEEVCEIFKGDPDYKGELISDEGSTYIECPTSGSNCGKLYVMDGYSTHPITVGWYVLN